MSEPRIHYYAGIGSRETPPEVCELMTNIARRLSKHGFVLRSGAALGADAAFEAGADPELKDIYIPWPKYNGSKDGKTIFTPIMLDVAQKYHPNWGACTLGARKLHARNSAIMLGPNGCEPVDFVVCWTADGQASGGTGQALRIAKDYGIPVFNLHDDIVPKLDAIAALIKKIKAEG